MRLKKGEQFEIRFNCEIYCVPVLVYLGGAPEKALERAAKALKIDSINVEIPTHSQGSAIFLESCKGVVIWLRHWRATPKDYSVLCHETIHAAHEILRSSGVQPLGWDNDEPVTYLVDYLVYRILSKLE